MNREEMKSLAGRAETVRGRADVRLAEVHTRIRSARRRRAGGAIASVAAVVVALVLGIASLTSTSGTNKNIKPDAPADSYKPAPDTARKVVYSDDFTWTPQFHIGTILVGDREVDIDQTLHTTRRWPVWVTDAGVVYGQDDDSVWFTDGGTPRKIAGKACSAQSEQGLATGTAGPLAVWVDCAPGSRGDLVVFDTSAGQEVARHTIPSCAPRGRVAPLCGPVDVIGEHVYFTPELNSRRPNDYQLDLTTDRVIRATPQMYADDLRTNSRALVIGDSWQTGYLTQGSGFADGEFISFSQEGSRLVPRFRLPSGEGPVPGRAFDAATGRPVRLRLPAGYHPSQHLDGVSPGDDVSSNTFFFAQWLDDDTIALAQGDYDRGDLITCHLSDGSCHLTLRAAPPVKTGPADFRIVAGLWLPG